MIRRVLILAGLMASLGLTAWEVRKKEHVIASGETVLLELAPVDPRSLIQGDYMRLDYAVARRTSHGADWPRDGVLVVRPDEDGVAQFIRVDRGEPLAIGDRRLSYRIRGGRLQVGTNAFYFQEGEADTYATARYGALRVAPDGTALLIGLMDAERRPLGAR